MFAGHKWTFNWIQGMLVTIHSTPTIKGWIKMDGEQWHQQQYEKKKWREQNGGDE